MNDEMAFFEWSVRALAQPPAVQLTLFPEFTCVADELGLDFEEGLRNARESPDWLSLSPDQTEAIEALDRKIEAISGPTHLEFWEDEALFEKAEWGDIRQLARAVIALLAWDSDPPPLDRSEYVGPPE